MLPSTFFTVGSLIRDVKGGESRPHRRGDTLKGRYPKSIAFSEDFNLAIDLPMRRKYKVEDRSEAFLGTKTSMHRDASHVGIKIMRLRLPRAYRKRASVATSTSSTRKISCSLSSSTHVLTDFHTQKEHTPFVSLIICYSVSFAVSSLASRRSLASHCFRETGSVSACPFEPTIDSPQALCGHHLHTLYI